MTRGILQGWVLKTPATWITNKRKLAEKLIQFDNLDKSVEPIQHYGKYEKTKSASQTVSLDIL